MKSLFLLTRLLRSSLLIAVSLASISSLFACARISAPSGAPLVNVTGPQIAMDDMGNAIVVASYAESAPSGAKSAVFYNIFHSSRPGWEYAMANGNLLTDKDAVVARNPVVAMGSSYKGIVAWEQWDGRGYKVYARRYGLPGGWTFAEQPDTRAQGNHVGDARKVQTAMNAGGQAVVVWVFQDRIWANQADSVWEVSSAISLTGGPHNRPHNPQVAIDDAGNALAVWQQGTNIVSNRYRPPPGVSGRRWKPASQVEEIAYGDSSGPATNPRIVVDSTGYAILVFERAGAIYSMASSVPIGSSTGFGWGAETPIPGVVGPVSDLQLDDNGSARGSGSEKAVAVWRTDTGNAIYASVNNLGTWAPAVPIASGIGRANAPRVAMTGVNARVVWSQRPSLGSGDAIYTSEYDTGTDSWSSPPSVVPSGARSGDVAMSTNPGCPSDCSIVVWDTRPITGTPTSPAIGAHIDEQIFP